MTKSTIAASSQQVSAVRPFLRLVRPIAEPNTMAVVKGLYHEADELLGLVVVAKFRDGREMFFKTGQFATNAAEAVNASMRATWRFTQMQEEEAL